MSFYLGPRRTCALGESCALPSLSPEVMRADDDTRDAYEQALRQIVDEVSSGLGDTPDDARAIAFLALLSGGATLARGARSRAGGAHRRCCRAVCGGDRGTHGSAAGETGIVDCG
ncbi:hypothetical protein [Burkholderia ubonensis]|uniref:hypothetical protein n=1 Tax=Burkholderia ubonensis TaxID=101571 RepID=UPI0015C8C961|nr:hypothetical protein [Burkholderia ubonensis]